MFRVPALPRFGLTKPWRKFIGTFVCVAFILVYIFIAGVFGDAVVQKHWAIQTPFFIVLGLLWVWPVMVIIRWMERPDPGQEHVGIPMPEYDRPEHDRPRGD